MSETALTDSQANALAGTTDPDLDITYCDIGEAQYYTTDLKKEAVVLRILKGLPGACRVYKDGDLTFGVRPGKFLDGTAERNYAGAEAQSLTADAALTKNTTGFPSTPHIPLATIVTSSGAYAHSDVTDLRSRSAFQLAGGLTITAGDESADKRTITVQGGPWRQKVRLWIATSDYGAPSASGNTVSIAAGTILQTIVANADYEVISDATGKVDVDITISGAASRYILAEVDERIYSSGEVTWAA
jgi:hypothetical protein